MIDYIFFFLFHYSSWKKQKKMICISVEARFCWSWFLLIHFFIKRTNYCSWRKLAALKFCELITIWYFFISHPAIIKFFRIQFSYLVFSLFRIICYDERKIKKKIYLTNKYSHVNLQHNSASIDRIRSVKNCFWNANHGRAATLRSIYELNNRALPKKELCQGLIYIPTYMYSI